ncbi:MAG: alpha/beta hydrolase [Pseudomonadota bacterium]
MIWTRLAASFLFIAALIGGFAVYVSQRAASRVAEINAAYPPQGAFVEVEGLQIHGVVLGSDEGAARPDVVLIHGASGSTRDFTIGLAPLLAERYRVIVLDRPGLGHSDALPFDAASIEDQARVLQKAASAFGAEKPIVVGQSYGGAVSLAWAVNHPDTLSGLLPLAAASNLWVTGLDALYVITTNPIGRTLVVPMITAFAGKKQVDDAIVSIFKPQKTPEGYGDDVGGALILRTETFRSNAEMRKRIKEEIRALVPRYSEISVPTEIIHGTSDTIVPHRIHSDKLAEQIEGAVYTKLDGVGHMPHHTNKEDVIAAVDRLAARAQLR